MEHEEFDQAKKDAEEMRLVDALIATFANYRKEHGEPLFTTSCMRALVFVLARDLAQIPDRKVYLCMYGDAVNTLTGLGDYMRTRLPVEQEEPAN